jgi:Alpha amylase, catalytic domain
MRPWPKYPLIYEINTWVWLGELSRKYQRPIHLGVVPEQEWDALAAYGFHAVWLMGVWERSPLGSQISLRNEGLVADFMRALPDFSPADNVGSPYCIRRYVVDAQLGGPEGLRVARAALRARGLRLILDFVPNHVAPDHPWTVAHPEYLLRASRADLERDPASFLEANGTVFACGRDPYFPAWPDVLQLNAFQPGLRRATLEIVSELAEQCDGIRCDMAMLLMNDVFARTWGARAGEVPGDDYWPPLVRAIKAQRPDFCFLAEAYWDLEWQLQQQGFDFCYDKGLYDRMERADAEGVRRHLLADGAYQDHLVRFIENHDEPRASSAFVAGHARAAAVALLTLNGAKLLHEGQLEGRERRLPVFLARRPEEPVDEDLSAFYRRLLSATARPVFSHGAWSLCEQSGWPDNQSFLRVLSWCWAEGEERYLVVINFGPASAQARIRVPWQDLPGRTWCLSDALSEESHERSGSELSGVGLYVALKPWASHVFALRAL